MAPATNNDSKTTKSLVKPKKQTTNQAIKSLRIKLNLGIGLWLLTVAGFVGGFYFFNLKMQKIPSLIPNNQAEIAHLQNQIDNFDLKLNSTKQNITQAIGEIKNILTRSQNPSLDQAKALIADAVWVFEVKENPEHSAKILQKAIMILQESQQNPILQNNLNKAVIDLLNLPSLDTENILRTISKLNLGVDDLALHKAKIKTNNNHLTDQNLANDIWHDIKNLIKIKRDDTKTFARIFSQEAQTMAYMLVKLQLKSIKLASLLANQKLFVSNIGETINLIETMFDSSQTNTKKFVASLAKLKTQSVQLGEAPKSFNIVKEALTND